MEFMTYLIKNEAEFEDVLKVFGTILIVVAAVFLIVAGYSEKQIAPVIGLFGTIVGYILGNHKANATKSYVLIQISRVSSAVISYIRLTKIP